MNNETKENQAFGGWAALTVVIVITVIVGISIYQYIAEPYRITDELKEHLQHLIEKHNVTKEYAQGWNDCAEYYLWLQTAPTNTTGG